jgi:hypothetical protein
MLDSERKIDLFHIDIASKFLIQPNVSRIPVVSCE